MSEAPKRIQLSRRKGWRMPENTVSVARGPGYRPYANRFVIGVHGTREQCVDKFRAEWEEGVNADVGIFRALFMTLLRDIRGKNLACWCPLDAPCHGDVLLELANKDEAQ